MRQILVIVFTVLLSAVLQAQDALLYVHVINNGYGDCLVIDARLSDKPCIIMIDAGNKKFRKKIYKYLKRKKLLPVDIIILTHPHPDHYGSLPYLLPRINAKHFYWNGELSQDKEFSDFFVSLTQSSISISTLKKDDVLSLGSFGTLACFNPEQYLDNDNDNSLVLLLTYRDTSFLFAGDIGPGVQYELTRQYPNIFLTLGFLKLPHHGDVMHESFVSAVEQVPFPVLTIGKNKYQYPAIETLKTFNKKLLRTDCCINIIVSSNGTTIERLLNTKK